MNYDAFISYSHAIDGELAPSLQKGLQKFGKPFYKLRELAVFRDETALSVNPSLLTAIENALKQSRYLILLASPKSAESKWVQRELDYWLQNRDPKNIILVITDGKIKWDDELGDFDWSFTTAIPKSLSKYFNDEPLYIDLTWAHNISHISLDNVKFLDAIADISASIHGISKDEIAGEEIRQHKLTKLTMASTIVVLTLMLIGLTFATYFAFRQKNIAQHEFRTAIGNSLVAQAGNFLMQNDNSTEFSVLLSLEAIRLSPTLAAIETLRKGIDLLPDSGKRINFSESGTDINFSPDGQIFAAGDQNGKVTIYSIEPLKEILSLPFDVYDFIYKIIFSHNGQYLAIAGGKNLTIWKRNGDQWHMALQKKGSCKDVGFSITDSLVAAACNDGAARVWKLDTLQEIATFDHKPVDPDRITISQDEKYIGTTSTLNTANVWSLENHQNILSLQHDTPDRLWGIWFSPKGDTILTASESGIAILWDFPVGKVHSELHHNNGITLAQFDSSGQYLVTGSWDATARIWNVSTGHEIRRLVHDSIIRDLEIDPSGTTVYTASSDGTVRIWDIFSGIELMRAVHEGSVEGISIDSTQKRLVSITEKGEVGYWNISNRSFLPLLENDHGINGEKFSLDGNYYGFYSDTPSDLSFFDTNTGEKCNHIPPLIGFVLSDFSLGGSCNDVAVVGTFGAIQITKNGLEKAEANLYEARNWYYRVSQSSDGSIMAIGQDHFKVINTIEKKDILSTQRRGSQIWNMSLSNDGNLLAATWVDGHLELWDIQKSHRISAQEIALEGDNVQYPITIIDPTNHYIGIIKNHKAFFGKISEKINWILIPNNDIEDIAFDPNGEFLATGSKLDNTVRVWELSSLKEVAKISIQGHFEKVHFNSDGKKIIASSFIKGSSERLIYKTLWKLNDLRTEACKRLTRNLTADEWSTYVNGIEYSKTCEENI